VRPTHLLHPLRSIRRAEAIFRERLERMRFAERGRKQFAGDPRYDLNAVAKGFADRVETEVEDTAILERICSAYQKAYAEERFALEIYRPTGWWEIQRYGSLQPVMNALANGNIEALRRMYRNFYRDACSAGLIVVQSLAKEYFGGRMTRRHRRYVLADTLYRVDHWKKMINTDCAVHELAGPPVGNPFGVMMEGTLVRAGAEYQHFCAMKVAELLKDDAATVVEIGGGFGGMAYYFLRDCPRVRYMNFDLAETVALASYFLMRSHPGRKFVLYGEAELCEKSLAKIDVALLPVFALRAAPLRAAVTFSSHAMSDLNEKAQEEYAAQVSAMKCEWLLCTGHTTGMDRLHAALTNSGAWRLERERELGWNVHRNAQARELERLYGRQE
jgi:putative sugar O-methyltransferase